MKKSLTCLAIALLLSLSVQAAQRSDQKGLDLDSIAAQLQLDSTQTSQLSELMSKHREQMRAMRDDKQQQREKMHEIRDQHREQLLIVLSYEQMYKFEQYMRENRPHRKQEKSTSQ
jgi:Skp family chaperone for outer membrane proteins